MKTSPLKIGGITLPSNILQAPLAGYTDFMYRKNCLFYGAGLCYTEMISAKGLFYRSENTRVLLTTSDCEKIKAVQIFGENAEVMRAACESEELSKFDIIDINMGCPVPKLYKNGEGAALINDLHKASSIIKECVKSGKIITVKTRIGTEEGKPLVAEDFAKMAEDSGASALTLHGRVRTAYYSGEPNYAAIAAAKKAVNIPVIANGGIFDKETCDKLYNATGADGVMIASGSIGRPWIFKEVVGETPEYDVKKLITEHIDGLKSIYDDRYVAVTFRKFIAHYLKGISCKDEKAALMNCVSTDEMKKIIENIEF